ncbi:MAG: DNA polymerase [Candidatus Thiodiazotropha taylori]|uniref:DNA polymerase n=1 Tax=Candidatus Thiodiazotropha taylori TaxID=2792791 RepID=A0A9E4N5U6_9GAMM|nr:DNA polymerase [Candidatus Thiodiazotropha taylori]MCW4258181.1 DNA polymerase [Candidatus Thiodiazotropha taylori]
MNLYLDFETRSKLNIKKVGGAKYCMNCGVLLLAYAFDDGPVRVIDFLSGGRPPDKLIEALADPEVTKIAQNVPFERRVMKYAMGIDIPINQWRDLKAKSLSLALPESLEMIGSAVGLAEDKSKDARGKKLIQKFCTPRRPSKKNPNPFWLPEDYPEDWQVFIEYCRQDVETLRHLWKLLPDWNYPGRQEEVEIWELDQVINSRGLPIDIETVEGALCTVNRTVLELDQCTQELSGGALQSMKQAATALDYIRSQGVPILDMTKATVAETLERNNLPAHIKGLLEVRQQVGKTSNAKCTKLKDAAINGRVKECFVYSGAGRTKRWAGRLVQFQNLPRGIFEEPDDIYLAADAIAANIVDFCYDDPMAVISSSIRPMIAAEPNSKLVVSDLANIEGRVIAWLADERWKLQAFDEYDRGEGPDLYKLSYSKSFNVTIDQVTKKDRQIGKVQELALGFEGGVGAFVTMASTYHLDLESLPELVLPYAPEAVIAQAEKMWAWAQDENRTHDLDSGVFIACDTLKRLWRRQHPAIVKLWADVKTAAENAILTPDTTFVAGKLAFRFVKHKGLPFLLMRLPSGGYLCYFKPAIERGSITYWGMSQSQSGARKWMKLGTYGGKLVENATQATARDVLARNMLAIDETYSIIGTVHDEVITEAPKNEAFTDQHLSELLATNPPWAMDLPLAAAGYEARRYRKD